MKMPGNLNMNEKASQTFQAATKFQGNSGNFPGEIREMSRSFPETSAKCPRYFQDMS